MTTPRRAVILLDQAALQLVEAEATGKPELVIEASRLGVVRQGIESWAYEDKLMTLPFG